MPLRPQKWNLRRFLVIGVKVDAKSRIRVPSLLAARRPQRCAQAAGAAMDKYAERDRHDDQLGQEKNKMPRASSQHVDVRTELQ